MLWTQPPPLRPPLPLRSHRAPPHPSFPLSRLGLPPAPDCCSHTTRSSPGSVAILLDACTALRHRSLCAEPPLLCGVQEVRFPYVPLVDVRPPLTYDRSPPAVLRLREAKAKDEAARRARMHPQRTSLIGLKRPLPASAAPSSSFPSRPPSRSSSTGSVEAPRQRRRRLEASYPQPLLPSVLPPPPSTRAVRVEDVREGSVSEPHWPSSGSPPLLSPTSSSQSSASSMLPALTMSPPLQRDASSLSGLSFSSLPPHPSSPSPTPSHAPSSPASRSRSPLDAPPLLSKKSHPRLRSGSRTSRSRPAERDSCTEETDDLEVDAITDSEADKENAAGSPSPLACRSDLFEARKQLPSLAADRGVAEGARRASRDREARREDWADTPSAQRRALQRMR